MLYYDGNGNQVDEPVSGGKQFRSDDPLRPDAPKSAAPAVFGSESFRAPADDAAEDDQPEVDEKAVAAPSANKARKSSANK